MTLSLNTQGGFLGLHTLLPKSFLTHFGLKLNKQKDFLLKCDFVPCWSHASLLKKVFTTFYIETVFSSSPNSNIQSVFLATAFYPVLEYLLSFFKESLDNYCMLPLTVWIISAMIFFLSYPTLLILTTSEIIESLSHFSFHHLIHLVVVCTH